MRHWRRHLDKLAAKAPSKAELARKIDGILVEGAEAFIKRTGQARPAVLDNPNASWREKWLALEEGARLH